MANGNYHIYIHQTKEVIQKRVTANKVSSGSASRGTKVSSASESGGKSFSFPSQIPGSSIGNTVLNIVKNGWTAGAAIGIAVAVVKATEQAQKTVGKLAETTASQTGDYSWSTWWNNMATTQHNLFHPLSMAYWTSKQTEASWARANMKTNEQRSLLGDAVLNTATKGV